MHTYKGGGGALIFIGKDRSPFIGFTKQPPRSKLHSIHVSQIKIEKLVQVNLEQYLVIVAHSGSAPMRHKERATHTWERIMPSDKKQDMLDRTKSHT